ncbi:hypothetical protein Q5752_005843 [Cryptotrichosporon argae]
MSETTPLLFTAGKRSLFPPLQRVFFTSFLMSMTFAFTQTSLIWNFRTMTCEAYYTDRSWNGGGDRCAVHAVESTTARNIAVMSTVTTCCTIINVFLSGYWISTYGPKFAMFQQTFWAALRNLCQIHAQSAGGAYGIRVIQVTQLFNVLGAGGGYELCANAYVAILADHEARTSAFGVLAGMTMLGASAGYTFGGIVEHYFGYLAPFQLTFCLLVFCTIFGSLFLPYIAPAHATKSGSEDADDKAEKRSFLAPLKVFLPRPLDDGSGRRDYSLFLLGSGAFLSVLATGYVPLMLQLVATNLFGFRPAKSGFMLSLNLLVRAFFLTLCFPRIIAAGRRWLSTPTPPPSTAPTPRSASPSLEHPDSPTEAPISVLPNAAPVPSTPAAAPVDAKHGSTFDLLFLQYSILLDGALTALVSLARAPAHMYVAAAVLPFASGTGAACKGVALDFVSAAERADALSGIALVEKLARVSTTGLFGSVFAALSDAGKPRLVFVANGATAVLAFVMLVFVRMPRPVPAPGA